MTEVILDDFAYMRNGKCVKTLIQEEQHVIEPIAIPSDKSRHAILLLHGFSSTPAVFAEMIKPLQEKGYAIYCPVLPGHCSSIKDFAQVTYQQWVDSSELAYKEIAKCYEHVTILGLSLGGVLAYRLAQKYEIKCLFLLAPAMALNFPMKLARVVLQGLRVLGVKNIRAVGGDIHQGDFAELSYKKIPITALLELFTCIETTPTLFDMPCLSQVFLADHDKVINNKKVYDIFFDSAFLENSAHVIPLDGQRQLVLDCIPPADK